MGDNPVCVEIVFQIMLLTSARGNNAISLYVLSGCRNLKATLIPVQLNYGEYPTSWLHGIFGFDLKSGKGQTACEWKSTDAKVQYASTFPWGIIHHEFYRRHSNTKLPFAGCYLFGDNRKVSCFLVSFLHSFHPNRNQCLTPLKTMKTKSSIYAIKMSSEVQINKRRSP